MRPYWNGLALAETLRVALVARSAFVCVGILLELGRSFGEVVLSATGSGVLTGSGV